MKEYQINYYTANENFSFVAKAPNVVFAKDVVTNVMSKNEKFIEATIYMKKGFWSKTPNSNWMYIHF